MSVSLPEEVLDNIIRLGGPYSSPFDVRQPYPLRTKFWTTCGLVCRRWNRITLPHLFRRICIADFDAEKLNHFMIFLARNPDASRCILELIFKCRDNGPMLLLSTLALVLELLPRLQRLGFSGVRLVGHAGTHIIRGEHQLEKLVQHLPRTRESREPTARDGVFIQLLALFSRIGTLELCQTEPHAWSPMDCQGGQSRASHWPQILELNFRLSTTARYYRLRMISLGMLRNLTCLTITCELTSASVKDVVSMGNMLDEIGGQLGELYLDLEWDGSQESSNRIHPENRELSCTSALAFTQPEAQGQTDKKSYSTWRRGYPPVEHSTGSASGCSSAISPPPATTRCIHRSTLPKQLG